MLRQLALDVELPHEQRPLRVHERQEVDLPREVASEGLLDGIDD